MCGFVGVVAWDDRFRVDRETLAKMSARIAHRGPDGEGLWINHEQEVTRDRPQVALAHRRLAILDPDPRANQPFTDNAGRWIVFNGEIYNFRELRKELTALRPEYAWRTNCDTEVLLVAYDAWGEKCVERLNGMFAFAVWDEPAKVLYLARDRMGQKPLYYTAAVTGPGATIGALAFASELSAFRCLPWFDSTPDDDAVRQYLRWGWIPSHSIYNPMTQLLGPAGWNSFADAFSKNGGCYFFSRGMPPAPADPVPQTRELVRRAVERQLVSDVPLGCFLSGGIDSSIIAAAMKAAVPEGQPVLTFSIGFNDPRYDETAYATAVAKYLGTEHRSFVVEPNAAEDLPKLAQVFGEPFGDSSALPTHYLSRQTRQYVKVALSGDGGDELFGGYDRYRAIEWSRQLEGLVPTVASERLARLDRGHPKSRVTRAGRFFRSLSLPIASRYSSYLRLFNEDAIDELLVDAPERQPEDRIAALFDALLKDGATPAQAAAATDRKYYLPADLLTKVDRASMLHALEVRSPFMDHELVSFAAGLTTDQLLRGGPKRMLREAFAGDLPAWVFKRKKMGFAVPIGDWLRTSLRPMLHDLLFATNSFAAGHFNKPVLERMIAEHQEMRVDHSQRLYALLMLELWWRIR